jgi:trk system potassium uptake protein TrkA
MVLNEILITGKSPVCDKTLKDINIPKDCVVISVIRNDDVIIPNGFTMLKDGDYIITVSSSEDQAELRDYFVGKESSIF